MSAQKKFIAFTLFVSLLIPLSAVGRPVKVAASIFPLMDFVRQVAGERADVRLLLPPGADVHTWQPRPGDMLSLSRTDLFIFCGGNLEPWAEKLIRNYRNSGGQVLEAGASLAPPGLDPKAEAGPDSRAADPHLWLDLGLDETIVLRIADALAGLDPDGRATYLQRAEAYIQKLRALDGAFRQRMLNCRGRTIVLAGHAAFGYLASRYGLRQAALYGLSPDSEPAPRRVVQIIELIKRENLSAIFFIKNESRKLAEVLARETKARLRPLHPAHNLTRDELQSGLTFLDIMAQNLENLVQGLSCEKK